MIDMVERVAMALASDMEEGFPRYTQQRWDQLTIPARAAFRQRARVAIESMREPTDTMRQAGYLVTVDDEVEVYQAMIDAALTTHPLA